MAGCCSHHRPPPGASASGSRLLLAEESGSPGHSRTSDPMQCTPNEVQREPEAIVLVFSHPPWGSSEAHGSLSSRQAYLLHRPLENRHTGRGELILRPVSLSQRVPAHWFSSSGLVPPLHEVCGTSETAS